MTQSSERLQIIYDFIRDASSPFMVIDMNGDCLFENSAMQRLQLTGSLIKYLHDEFGRRTIAMGAHQSTPVPFSFKGPYGRKRANIRRVTTSQDEVILLIKIMQSENMAAFTMASQSEQVAALQTYKKRRVSDRFASFFKTAREGNAILNRNGYFLHANPALLKMIGLSEKDLSRKAFFDVISEAGVEKQVIDPVTSLVDLSQIAPSEFDAVLHGHERDIPISVSLAASEAGKNLEFFLSVRDLTDSRRYAEVQKLNSELDMANKAMDEFNRLMSHEMRAPLSKLVSIAENLRSFGALDPEADHYVTMMEEAAKDALLQYSSILSLSRGSKREIVQFKPIELVERLMRQHALIAEQHEVQLIGGINGNRHAAVPVDATDVFLIVTNLVSNALKHTKAGDEVRFTITVDEDKQMLELNVSDTGSGISEALRPRIYDAFVTTAEGMDIQSGIGVGLALVKRAVELRKGQIDFTSNLGQGTTFNVTLPFSKQNGDIVYQDCPADEITVPKCTVGDTILLVDDDVVNLQILSARLKAYGYNVLTASGGTGALRILKATKVWPKLIFIDRNMPDLNGLETTRIIRSRFRDNESFICGLTAYVDDEIIKDMTLAGMDCVEQKPLGHETLEKYLDIAAPEAEPLLRSGSTG